MVEYAEVNLPPCNEEMKKYFLELDRRTKVAYELAGKARARGYDPETKVDIPLTTSVPERSEKLVATQYPELNDSGVAKRIKELEKQYVQGDWRIALTIGEEIALQKHCKFKTQIEGINAGAKVALAYLTLGIIAAPLEGLVEIKFKDRLDGGKYLAVYFSGPIRAAGGTALSTGSMIVDYIRSKLNIQKYDITDIEVKRYQTEIADYLRLVGHRQYIPTDEELAFILTRIGVEITGDPTEDYDVSRYRHLDRVETDKIRGGMVLVVTEGPTLKAEKIAKKINEWGKSFGFTEWDWINDFIKLKKEKHSVAPADASEAKILPNKDYLADIVAGRPVLGHPMRKGAFRLRYGRARSTGFAAQGLHPATMKILNDYIATGTQLKVERPGKATIINPCETIDGPKVLLNNGDYLWLETEEQAELVKKDIKEITFAGDVLINFGDFSENGKRLAPAGYCEEWWALELKEAVKDKTTPEILEFINKPHKIHPNFEQAKALSEEYKIPLHPRFTFNWGDITKDQILDLRVWINSEKIADKNKRTLELIGCPHKLNNNIIIFENDYEQALLLSLNSSKALPEPLPTNGLELINSLSPIRLRDKSGTPIGMRMGRPEKAKEREMKGSPHGLFPVGKEGDRTRSFQKALEVGCVTAEFPMYHCSPCNNHTIYPMCEKCGNKAIQLFRCPTCKRTSPNRDCHGPGIAHERKKIDISYFTNVAKNHLTIRQLAPLVKGVVGTWNKDHIPENFCKVLLRAKHNIHVNKDGTTRYDMTEAATTHFRPKEIGTSIKKLRELGYEKDFEGKPLEHEDQLLAIYPQDVILPACDEADKEGADKVLFRVTQFLDELLVRFYKVEPYYNLRTPNDLVGHLVIGLAPHTSGGIMGRIIGFSRTQGCYSHHYWHAAQRRNLDGDETCVILAMDAFLNFSRQFLPDKRGGRSMDAPLVLTTILSPTEIDDEVHGLDCMTSYPLEFYNATLEAKYPMEVKMKQVKHLLNTPAQYDSLGFTHEVSSLNAGVRVSAYKFIPTMVEKLDGQIDLAKKLRAVDLKDVGHLVIEKHFLKDIRGNLRKWSLQQFRCVKCNAKYRRPPLAGSCNICGGRLIFTIAEGSIKKYMEPSLKLAKECNVSPYLQQNLAILKKQMDTVFGEEKTKQQGLAQFFEK